MFDKVVEIWHSLLMFNLINVNEDENNNAELVANEALNSHYIIINPKVNHYGG